MKVTCNREKMLGGFQTVAPVAPARSPKPILRNIKLDVRGEQATLMATDLELGIHFTVPGVDVETPGAAILPIGQFGSILRESVDETLRIEADAQGTVVQGTRSEFRLAGADPDEFPEVAQFAEEAYWGVPAGLFREMIRRTIFAIDTESSRYALAGVLLEIADERIAAIGTDGRRLAKMEGPVTRIGEADAAGPTIVPGRAMHLIERALSDADGEVQIVARSSEVLFRSERATIYSRLLEGRYPRWRDVFPRREKAVRIEFSVGPLYGAVRQAAIVTSEESRGIDFAFGEGMLVLSGQTADVGQARVELPIGYHGENISITLDPRFVIDFLKVLDAEKNVTLELEDAEGAVVATTDDGYAYVIMPLSRDRARS